jgi:peptide/nickel transport system substrate-binding protein
MRPFVFPFLAAVSLIVSAGPADAATRPRYGDTLHIEIRAQVRTLDPADWPDDAAESAAKEKLAALIFERLIRIDENGRPEPALAVSWNHDAARKQWRFRLRPGVRFHNGTELTPEGVVAALRSYRNKYLASATDDGIVIQSDRPAPHLLHDLAQPRHPIFLRDESGNLAGSGPFEVLQWDAGRRVVLRANEGYSGGRPFLDQVVIEMGRSTRDQLLDLELGRAEIVEVPPPEIRGLEQRGMKIWSSAPKELVALMFESGNRAGEEPRLREAIALAIDRAAMHNVWLQKRGEISGGLLPQWLSGYAFLFPTLHDPVRARQILAGISPGAPALTIGYDSADALARALSERIAVNLREAGIKLHASGLPAAPGQAEINLRMVRVGIGSLHPAHALAGIAAALRLPVPSDLPGAESHDALYRAERMLLDGYRIIPLFHLPESYALSPRMKTWNAPGILKNGEWRLENVWLEGIKP